MEGFANLFISFVGLEIDGGHFIKKLFIESWNETVQFNQA